MEIIDTGICVGGLADGRRVDPAGRRTQCSVDTYAPGVVIDYNKPMAFRDMSLDSFTRETYVRETLTTGDQCLVFWRREGMRAQAAVLHLLVSHRRPVDNSVENRWISPFPQG